jgi:hypothetical protein
MPGCGRRQSRDAEAADRRYRGHPRGLPPCNRGAPRWRGRVTALRPLELDATSVRPAAADPARPSDRESEGRWGRRRSPVTSDAPRAELVQSPWQPAPPGRRCPQPVLACRCVFAHLGPVSPPPPSTCPADTRDQDAGLVVVAQGEQRDGRERHRATREKRPSWTRSQGPAAPSPSRW